MKRLENIGRILSDANDGVGAGVSSLDDLPEAGAEVAGGNPDNGNEGGTQGGNEGGGQGGAQYEVPTYWQQLSQALSSEERAYEIPEVIKTGKTEDGKELTPEESFQMLAREIQANTRIPELEDPFVRDYVTDRRKFGEKFEMDKFVERYAQQQEISNMSDEDYFFRIMQQENGQSEENPNGWTDEEIRADISSRSRIALSRERKALEAEQMSRYQAQVEAREAEMIQRQREEIILRQKADDARLLEVENYFKENRNINGIEVGESDMASALEEFKVLNQYDDHGQKPLFKLFENDKDLFKAFFLVRSNGSLVKDILSGMKNEQAKSILERTSLHPKDPANQFGGVGNSIPTKEDLLDLV